MFRFGHRLNGRRYMDRRTHDTSKDYERGGDTVLGSAEYVRQLHVGDNLGVMRRMETETVDLVYLDPPFNSNQNYRIVFRGPAELKSRAYLPAFEDVWSWDDESEDSFRELTLEWHGEPVGVAISGLLTVVGRDRMMAYLVNMTLRLIEIRRLLKPTGSVYLHCDPTASHYLKVLMDAVFGRENFRNEIVWCYRGGGVPRRDFARKHDLILRFSKSDEYVFNPQYTQYSQASMELVTRRGGVSVDGLERDLERGAHMTDWWSDINSLQTWSPERTGYPTQKPVRLLERIIRSSSNEGDLVLDPFCGCGTTLVAAERLGRQWAGIDVEPMSLNVLRARFEGEGIGSGFDVEGLPSVKPFDREGWAAMAVSEREQFERAVIGLIPGCVPWRNRQSKSGGMEGLMRLAGDAEIPNHAVINVVGGGPLSVKDVRRMMRTLDSETGDEVLIGVLASPFDVPAEVVETAIGAGEVVIDGRSCGVITTLGVDEVLGADFGIARR